MNQGLSCDALDVEYEGLRGISVCYPKGIYLTEEYYE